MYTGIVDLPWWGYILVTLILTHITIAAVTIYLHRHQAHRSVELHLIVTHFFRFWLWLTTGLRTREWVAVHRKHHARVETMEDPHSPYVYGIKKVLWDGVELYRAAANILQTQKDYGHGTPNDWLERYIYVPRNSYGIALMLIINLILFGPMGLSIWAIQMMWIPLFAAGVVNGLGHYWGYRNYETTDASSNLCPWGILIGGEELHNNHHAYASSAKLSAQWYEFDIGWFYIKVLEFFGLAKVKSLAPKAGTKDVSGPIDIETLRAVITNHLHVMSHFTATVVERVHKEELKRIGDQATKELLKPVPVLMKREESRLDESARERLLAALQHSQALETVYQFKQSLQKVWKDKSLNQENLLRALQEWCVSAEATGIKWLQEFATWLRGYTLSPT